MPSRPLCLHLLPWILFLAPLQVLLSVFAIICLNIVLALYHRPGRYAGF
jgi:hypothetical protein